VLRNYVYKKVKNLKGRKCEAQIKLNLDTHQEKQVKVLTFGTE
jgi:hypothetical protein